MPPKLKFRFSLGAERLTLSEAGELAGISLSALRCLADANPISYYVGIKRRFVSRIALRLCLSKDDEALKALVAEQFHHPRVAAAYRTEGLPLPTDAGAKEAETATLRRRVA